MTKLAPHVQAAIAAGQGRSAQPKGAGGVGRLAPHVQAAIALSLAARAPGTSPEGPACILPKGPAAASAVQRMLGQDEGEKKEEKLEVKKEDKEEKEQEKKLRIEDLKINNDYPPTNHAVVDSDISDKDATCCCDYKVKLIGVGFCFSDSRFSVLMYQVGPFSNVGCLWPKKWPAPAPNRFGYLPKAQFANNPGDNSPRKEYPSSMTVTYKAMDGKIYTKTIQFS